MLMLRRQEATDGPVAVILLLANVDTASRQVMATTPVALYPHGPDAKSDGK